MAPLRPAGLLRATGYVRPPGVPVVNWNDPINAGLVHAHVCDPGLPNLVRPGIEGSVSLQASGTFGVSSGGAGLTHGVLQSTTSAFSVPAVGTLLVYVTSVSGPTAGVDRRLFVFGGINAANSIHCIHYLDDNWYFGWYGGADNRVSGAASGTFVAGDTFVLGGTWGTGGTSLFIKGIKRYTNVTAPTTYNTADSYTIGGQNAGAPWIISTGDAVYYILVWQRVLTDGEIARISTTPWCWARFPSDDLIATLGSVVAAGGPVSADFRGPVEFSFALGGDIKSPVEALAINRGDLRNTLEVTAVTASDRACPVNFERGVANGATSGVEWLSQAFADRIVVKQWLRSWLLDAAVPSEWLSEASVHRTILSEWISSSLLDIPTPIDWLSLASSGRSVTSEWVSSSLMGIAMPGEWLLLASANRSVVDEWLGSSFADMAIPSEYLSQAAANGIVLGEWLGSRLLLVDMATPIEWLVLAAADRSIMGEWLKSSVLNVIVPGEWLSLFSSDRKVSGEWIGSSVRGIASPSEWLSLASADRSVLGEWLRSSLLDIATPREFTKAFLGDRLLPVEFHGQLQLTAERLMPIEWLALLAADRVLPIEWLAFPAMVRVSLERLLASPSKRRILGTPGRLRLVKRQ